MTRPRAEWQLDTRRLGRRVLVYDQLDSTNNLAAALADDPANDGVAILADTQTAGRGQHGRTWLAPPGASVLLSVLVFPPGPLRRPAVLTAWAAVSVCAVIQRLLGRPARIKWPNDVLLHGQKVCGILIEQNRGTVVGIGLNVQQTAEHFAQAGLPDATSLRLHAAPFTPLETAAVARELIRQLDTEYDLLCAGETAALEACWKWHLGLLGKQVVAECPDGTYRGRLLDLSFAGVELERAGTLPLVLEPEKIQHLSGGSGSG
jgi:BirA family biotin operon repressor/biotin-[acetyl-CoA-carboxylase] ligase